MQNMISKTNKPYFIWWDQDVTEDDVREALKSDNLYTRITYMSYILNDAEFEDIWKFLKVKDVQENFWRIRWRTATIQNQWQQLLTLLGTRLMSVLTHAQRAFLSNFFARTRAFYLTGGGALAEYYLGHRLSQDIDLFTQDREAWQSIESDLQAAAAAVGASLEFRAAQESNELHRAILRLPDEPDLKIDIVRDAPPHFGEPTMREDGVIVDTLENIAVGKLSALYGRAYPRDFVDLYFLLNSGVDFKKVS